ncbi:MAG TPA: DUF3943 domain-containing protein [Kofleriaceae bacterium]|nr:DUF3943 domain-containing protein [Kofleriaceae bacterium]
MFPRLLVGLTLVASVWPGRTASAQPDSDQVYQPAVTEPEDLPVKQKSYLVPTLEVVLGNAAIFTGAYLAGMDWAHVSVDTTKEHLSGGWAFDDDAYSTNQLGHPFTGSLAFSAARSTGHEFWVAGAYSFAGSLLWELVENEIPSTNDMITTPIGGMFIGEAMHRFSRALLYRGYGKPTWIRKTAASVIDPVGAINRAAWGDAWAKTIPPALNAHFAVGWQQPTHLLGAEHGGDGQLHVEAYVEHGVMGDRAFQPRRPLDHFTLQTAIDSSTDELEALLYVRGMLVGSGVRGDQVRGMYGLFSGYDYNSNHFVRASMLGIGPGGMVEARLGDRGYVAGTGAAYLVPYGAAGGVNEEEGPMNDHNDGPGMAQLLELQGGQRGLWNVRSTTRLYEIRGRLVGDDANEFVATSTLGARVQIKTHQAIGVEGTYSYRRADYADPLMNASTPDTTMDVRAFYAITTDEILGR